MKNIFPTKNSRYCIFSLIKSSLSFETNKKKILIYKLFRISECVCVCVLKQVCKTALVAPLFLCSVLPYSEQVNYYTLLRGDLT